MYIGTNDALSADRQRFNISQIFVHPDFRVPYWIPFHGTIVNDIALMKLATPIKKFTDSIKPLCLPDENCSRKPPHFDSIDGCSDVVTLAGFGTSGNTTHPSLFYLL